MKALKKLMLKARFFFNGRGLIESFNYRGVKLDLREYLVSEDDALGLLEAVRKEYRKHCLENGIQAIEKITLKSVSNS